VRGGVYESEQEEAKEFEELVASTTDKPLASELTFVRSSSLLHADEAWLTGRLR
jgi:hypothetical protein